MNIQMMYSIKERNHRGTKRRRKRSGVTEPSISLSTSGDAPELFETFEERSDLKIDNQERTLRMITPTISGKAIRTFTVMTMEKEKGLCPETDHNTPEYAGLEQGNFKENLKPRL